MAIVCYDILLLLCEQGIKHEQEDRTTDAQLWTRQLLFVDEDV